MSVNNDEGYVIINPSATRNRETKTAAVSIPIRVEFANSGQGVAFGRKEKGIRERIGTSLLDVRTKPAFLPLLRRGGKKKKKKWFCQTHHRPKSDIGWILSAIEPADKGTTEDEGGG